MKILVLGNLAAGKSTLAKELRSRFPIFEILNIDIFLRRNSAGSLEEERLAQQRFLAAIYPNKPQIIEATGVGEMGIMLAARLVTYQEPKLVIVLQTPLATCLARLQNRLREGNTSSRGFVSVSKMTLLAHETNALLHAPDFQKQWQALPNVCWIPLAFFPSSIPVSVLHLTQQLLNHK